MSRNPPVHLSKRTRAWRWVIDLCGRFTFVFRWLTATFIFGGGGLAGFLLFNGSRPSTSDLVGAAALLLGATGLEVLREKIGDELEHGESDQAKRRQAVKVLDLAMKALVPAGVAEYLGEQGLNDAKVLRVNVMRPDGERHISIWIQRGMDGDGDRDIRIESDCGVAGHAFTRCERPVTVDFVVNRADPRLQVYPASAQAAVRPELKCILATPIFHPYDKSLPWEQRARIGVLCVDSDLPIDVIGLGQEAAQDIAILTADLLAVTLA